MTDAIVAAALLDSNYRSIAPESLVAHAIGVLLEARNEGCGAETLLVIDSDGIFQGLLTTRQLFSALLSRWIPEGPGLAQPDLDDRKAVEERLFDEGRDYLKLSVEVLMNRSVESLASGDRLPTMIRSFADQQLQSIPVLEAGRVLGVVLVVDVYKAAAALALTPEDEGIRLDR